MSHLIAAPWPVAVLADPAKWVARTLPAGYTAADNKCVVTAGRAFVVASSGEWLFYDRGPGWIVSAPPYGFEAFGACWGGGCWWIVGRDATTLAPRLARSTDGALAQAWQVIVATVPPPDDFAAIEYVSGRLVALGFDGIYTSDDAGATWTERSGINFDYTIAGLQHWGGGLVSAIGGELFAVSTDSGTTWALSEVAGPYRVSSAAYMGAGAWLVSAAGMRYGDPVSDTWTHYVPPDSIDQQVGAHAGVIYGACSIAGEDSDPSQLRLGTLGGAIDAGSVFDFSFVALETPYSWLRGLHASGGRVAAWVTDPTSASRLYMYDISVPDERVTVEWPVEVISPVYVSTPWAVDIDPAPTLRAACGWPVVVAAPRVAAVAWPVSVLPSAVLGGLDGAGAWAAAPDGKWEAIVTLGGVDISAQLVGDCVVQIAADAARTGEFAFFPAAAIAPMGLIGQRVTMAFAQHGRLAVQSLFCGVVDVPEVDLVTGLVACRCTDQAQEVWASMPREAIDALVGGRWSAAVGGEPEDNFDYMQARLKSVAASWALDVQQQPRILPWRKPQRTFTVRAADIINGVGLSVSMPSRDQLRSRIVCRLQYRYPLLRYRGISAQYSQPMQFFMPTFDIFKNIEEPTKLLLTTAMVEGAAESLSGWELQSLDIEHPPAKTWNLGSELQPYFFIVSASVAPTLATGFRATYATRWQQTITEDYAVTVVWPSLESQIGAAVTEEIGATLESTFDAREWGADPSVLPSLGSGTGDAAMPWQVGSASAAARDEALRVLLDQAWVRLWGASRSGRVAFSLPCRPDLWCDDAVIVEHDRLRAAGDIVELEHTLSTESGAAVTAVTVAVGMPGNAPAEHPTWSIPSPPVGGYEPPLSAYSCDIGTYVGGSVSAPEWDADTMIGFSTNYQIDIPGARYYPHQLRIKSPSLAAEDRDPRELPVAAEIAVAVPTDLLEIL